MDAGSAVVQAGVNSTTAFQVVKINCLGKRTHTIPTILSRDDKSRGKLALLIQPLSVHQHVEGGIHVFANGDSYWCEHKDLGNFRVLRTQMLVYDGVAPSEHPSCHLLTQPRSSRPQLALTDRECPTILVLSELKRQGWRQDPSPPCRHQEGNIMVHLCDSRGGTKHKFYYQCLLDVRRSLSCTSMLPSNAYQKYYQCVLAGKRVEASMTDKQLRAALEDVSEDCVAVLPVEDEGLPAIADVAPVALVDPDLVVGEPVQSKKKKTPSPSFQEKSFLPLPSSVPEVAPDPVVGPPPPLPAGSSTDPVPGLVPAVPPAIPASLGPSEPPVGALEDGDLVVGAPIAAPAVAKGKKARVWEAMLDGNGEIFRDPYRPTAIGAVGYDNWICKFLCPDGTSWEKKEPNRQLLANLVNVSLLLTCTSFATKLSLEEL
jgi:hypothetical protein